MTLTQYEARQDYLQALSDELERRGITFEQFQAEQEERNEL